MNLLAKLRIVLPMLMIFAILACGNASTPEEPTTAASPTAPLAPLPDFDQTVEAAVKATVVAAMPPTMQPTPEPTSTSAPKPTPTDLPTSMPTPALISGRYTLIVDPGLDKSFTIETGDQADSVDYSKLSVSELLAAIEASNARILEQADSIQSENLRTGKTVRFRIGADHASETAEWKQGGWEELNLTVGPNTEIDQPAGDNGSIGRVPPHVFTGTASTGGRPAPIGTIISAWVDDVIVAVTTVEEERSPSNVNASRATFSSLGDNLLIVWQYSQSVDRWDFYAPSLESYGINTYANASDGDIVWVQLKEDALFQGWLARQGWNLLSLDSSATKPTPTPKPSSSLSPSPVEIRSHLVAHNLIGTPVLSVGLLNASDATVDAVEIQICPLNRFGESLKAYGFSDECLVGTTNSLTASGDLEVAKWTLFGYDTASQANLTILRVHFVDRILSWNRGRWVSR